MNNTTLGNFKKLLTKPLFYVSLIATIGLTWYIFQQSKAKHPTEINPAFAKYIAAYTSGTISKESSIRIQLASNFVDSINITKEANLFSFTPSIKGKTIWLDATTIEFKPDEALPSGTTYSGTFYLEKISDVASDLEEFPLSFSTIEQAFEVSEPQFSALNNQDITYQKIYGTLLTADVDDESKIEKIVSATIAGKSTNIKWIHAADKRTHSYYIDSVARENTTKEIIISWNGKPIQVDHTGSHVLQLPSLSDFKVMSIDLLDEEEQCIAVRFSDPIMHQNFNGLIVFSNINQPIDLRYTVSGNEVKCYPTSQLVGKHAIIVHSGIRNILGNPLKDGTQQTIEFTAPKPAINFTGKGVIMPRSNNLLLPFDAIGLKAIDVTIIKIYENNVSQFLQVNNLNGTYELTRVGRPLAKKTMRLDSDKLIDLRKTNRFTINLDNFIKTEPGAIYHVKLSFKKDYALYRCGTKSTQEDETELQMLDEEDWDGNNQENTYWDYYDEYIEGYNWNERDNPCHVSYYTSQRWVSRNIIASDIGLIAKQGNNNQIKIIATNLVTTQPLSGVNIDVLDYQQQVIASGTTNSNGMIDITVTRKPFLAVAKHQSQRGYLKLDDGSSLPVSHFDVTGNIIQKGVKGFIYGERGVWRPGDSIYLMFILEDKHKLLPPAHPVSMELFDPNGALFKRQVQHQSVNGFYTFHTTTDTEAPTGNWLAKIKVGAATFTKSLRIETVMPNRLKIELDFPHTHLSANQAVNATLKSRWLHGAIAGGLNTKVDITLTPTPTKFKGYDDYTFDDLTRRFNAEAQTIFDGPLDANGVAHIQSKITTESRAAGMLMANFTTKVFEAGGNFSIDRFSMPFHPYASYLGLKLPKGDASNGMLLTDTTHYIDIVNVNTDGKVVPGRKQVTVSVYKVQWRWWWDRSVDDLTSYAEAEEYQALITQQIDVINGKGKYAFRIDYPNWGRYLIKVTDNNGHSTSKTCYVDWPGWAGRAQRENAVEATMLTFTTDKNTYQVGDMATLNIPTAKGGRALVSIESGSQVVDMHWVEAKSNQTNFSFKVSKAMMPNVYVHITLIQPHNQTANDLPIRLYGMIPIKVEDKESILKPIITMSNELKTDETSTIKISEGTGKAMTYTLAIVDEGLLDLTRFKTPDAHSTFYAREALGVKTWDMFDYVMGAFGMPLNRILSIGGDEGINKKSGANKANRFKPVVKFLGPFHVKAGQSLSHQINISNYIGAVRVMVVAGHQGAYGLAEKSVAVKKPLMVLATLPRVLGPRETVKLPITVFAMDKSIKNVTVQVQSNAFLQVLGTTSKTIHFSKTGDQIIEFDVKVKQALGIGKVKVIASSSNVKATHDIELDVRNPNPYISQVEDGSLDAGKTWQVNYQPIGITGTNTAILEVSSLPALNLENRLRYLIQYPHGCAEQTTSAAFPQLALNNLMELNDGWKKQIEHNVKSAINKLKQHQQTDGGISYWQGEAFTDQWSSNYVGHFMIEAENNGYALPIGFLSNWKKYQRSRALTWLGTENAQSDLIQAYRLYTLALAKSPETGAMNRLKEYKNLSISAKWRLAATYAIIGQKEVAKQLIETLPLQISAHTSYQFTYGSDVRDEAMILETLILLGDKSRAVTVMQSIAKKLGSNQWFSTQTTAYALVAISKLTGKYNDNKLIEFTTTINGKTTLHKSTAGIIQIPVTVEGIKTGNLNVSNKGSQLLYTRLIVRGQPEIGHQKAAQNNLNLQVVYKDLKGKELNPLEIEQGTDFKMEVTISNPGVLGNYDNMALSQIFPSGWEIINTRMDDGDISKLAYSIPRYQDIRDDRVYTYFNLAARQKVTYCVLLNASYVGKYYMPGISCEAMYDGTISAQQEGYWINVIPRKNTTQPIQ